MGSKQNVTELLNAWTDGDQDALDQLMPMVYEELHRLAARRLQTERKDHTLQTTALVHEAYLRLVGQKDVRWKNRGHFFAIAAQLMRRILVDYARSHKAEKRGAGRTKIALEKAEALSGGPDVDMVALDEAMTRLEAIDPRQGRIVEMKFFAGLRIEEIAEFLNLSEITVKRDLRMAKAWLKSEMSSTPGP